MGIVILVMLNKMLVIVLIIDFYTRNWSVILKTQVFQFMPMGQVLVLELISRVLVI